MRHQAASVADVGAFGRPDFLTEGQGEPDVARAAALREGGRGHVGRAERAQRVLQEGAADAVRKERHRFRAILGLDLLQFLGHHVERFVPGDLGPFLLPALLAPDERRLQPVGIHVRADTARATRAQSSSAERVGRVAFDFPELPIPDVRNRPALPEADVAVGGNRPDTRLGRLRDRTAPGEAARDRAGGGQPGCCAGNLEETSPGNRDHDDRSERHPRFWPDARTCEDEHNRRHRRGRRYPSGQEIQGRRDW